MSIPHPPRRRAARRRRQDGPAAGSSGGEPMAADAPQGASSAATDAGPEISQPVIRSAQNGGGDGDDGSGSSSATPADPTPSDSTPTPTSDPGPAPTTLTPSPTPTTTDTPSETWTTEQPTPSPTPTDSSMPSTTDDPPATSTETHGSETATATESQARSSAEPSYPTSSTVPNDESSPESTSMPISDTATSATSDAASSTVSTISASSSSALPSSSGRTVLVPLAAIATSSSTRPKVLTMTAGQAPLSMDNSPNTNPGDNAGAEHSSAATTGNGSAAANRAGADNEPLPRGGLAGIVVGCVVAVLLLVSAFLVYRRRRRRIPHGGDVVYGSTGPSTLKRNGTTHSALDFSDGPLHRRTSWRRLTHLGVPPAGSPLWAGAEPPAGSGAAGVGVGVAAADTSSDEKHWDARSSEDGAPPVKASDTDDFRLTHYDDWLSYDAHQESPASAVPPAAAAHPVLSVNTSRDTTPAGALAAPRVSSSSPVSPASLYPPSSPGSYHIYDAYRDSQQPVLQRLPWLRRTPSPVTPAAAGAYAEPSRGVVGMAQ